MKRQKLEEKLKLWDNPAFLQLIEDLHNLPDNPVDIKQAVKTLKIGYNEELVKWKYRDSKYKQGKLEL